MESKVRGVEEILGQARVAVQGDWFSRHRPELLKILSSTRNFFKLLHSQKTRFRVEMTPARRPGEDIVFASGSMEEVTADPDAEGKPIAISVFPGLYKCGDGTEQNVSVL